LVEQRTENPCVPGSIPGGTTIKAEALKLLFEGFFIYSLSVILLSYPFFNLPQLATTITNEYFFYLHLKMK
jgi:hypothetical protein